MTSNPHQPTHTDQGKLAKKIKNFIYHPGDLIGSGFSSQVYKGINQLQSDPLKKSIAIKVIQLAKIQNQVQNYLLNNQVNALKLLKHPNILNTIDILMTKNNVYIVTQFCQGGDLLKYIKQNGPFTQIKALYLIKDVIQGYKCIQDNHIIHRDLKTSNIFLCKGKAKIADFGFCQFVGQKKPQIAYNVGSPAYMSPQSYKENIYSYKSDIWAIGIILYELLIGETPDRSLTYTEMANNLMNGKIKNIQNQQIKRILTLCFKKNLQQRIDAITLSQLISIELNRQQANMGNIGNIVNNNNNNQMLLQQNSIQINNNIIQNSRLPITTNINTNNTNNNINTNVNIIRNLSPAKKQQKSNQYFKSQISSSANKIPNTNINTNISSNNNVTSLNRIPPNNNQQRKPLTKQSNTTNNTNNTSNKLSNIIKPHTQYLLFLYRLLKFVVQLKYQKIYQILLPLFRHRSYIQILIQQCLQANHNLQHQESYKQFIYLKNRFDEVYLQHIKQNPNISKKSQYKDKLDIYSNMSFTNIQCLSFYRNIYRDICQQCINILSNNTNNNNNNNNANDTKYLISNRNQIGIVFDYLMIQYQLLGLHMQGININQIVTIAKIQSIIKQQPKKLTPGHIQLFKIKYNMFIRADADNNNVHHNNNIHNNNIINISKQSQQQSRASQQSPSPSPSPSPQAIPINNNMINPFIQQIPIQQQIHQIPIQQVPQVQQVQQIQSLPYITQQQTQQYTGQYPVHMQLQQFSGIPVHQSIMMPR